MEHRQVAKTLEILGWVVIVSAFIAGFALGDVQKVTTDALGYPDTVDEFSWRIAFVVWLVGLIIGFSLIGLSSLIVLLMELVEMTKQK